MKFQNIFSWLVLTAISIVAGYLIGLSVENSIVNVQAQSEKKTIKLANTIKPQLKITEVKVKQKDRKFNESFDAESDWVKNLSFKLESISDKPIVYLQANVNFPETRLTGELMSYTVIFGQLPGSEIKNRKPMLLMPGEFLEVSLDKEKDRLYKFVNERQPIESIQKVELEIGFIVFEDKTAWSAGSFTRQDPDNPNRYKPIENEPPQ